MEPEAQETDKPEDYKTEEYQRFEELAKHLFAVPPSALTDAPLPTEVQEPDTSPNKENDTWTQTKKTT